jgi:Leucine-rich repeat (LRR) protein
MSHNSLEHLDSTMFEPLPGIVHLNLSHNRLSILPDNAFANLASLRELDLSGNLLTANFKVCVPLDYD